MKQRESTMTLGRLRLLRRRSRTRERKVELISGDITKRVYCDSLIGGAISDSGRLDVVVNSVGRSFRA